MNWGTLTGALFSTGLALTLLWLRARKITLKRRVEPYLRVPEPDARPARSAQVRGPFAFFIELIGPWYRDLATWIQQFSHRSNRLRVRLEHAGSPLSPTEFRSQQVLWSMGGLVIGLLLAVPLAISGRVPLLLALFVATVFPISAALLRDWMLSQAITRRAAALATELPTIAELLALAVGAGEAPLGALERVTRRTEGELNRELRRTVSDVHAGTSMEAALRALAQRSHVSAVTRFADAISVAIDRGTPLAQVLHDQARDAREESRRQLMELSGRKEIAMLVPVVFFILPITVVFAIYPGLTALRGGL